MCVFITFTKDFTILMSSSYGSVNVGILMMYFPHLFIYLHQLNVRKFVCVSSFVDLFVSFSAFLTHFLCSDIGKIHLVFTLGSANIQIALVFVQIAPLRQMAD